MSEDAELVRKWRIEAVTASSNNEATTGDKAVEDKPQGAASAVVAPNSAIAPTADSQRLRICEYTFVRGTFRRC